MAKKGEGFDARYHVFFVVHLGVSPLFINQLMAKGRLCSPHFSADEVGFSACFERVALCPVVSIVLFCNTVMSKYCVLEIRTYQDRR